MSDGRTEDPPERPEGRLSDLRSRLEALHGSVERLGRDREAPPAPTYPGREVDPPVTDVPPAPYDHASEPDPYAPAPPAPAYDPAAPPYGQAPVDPYAPAPAATNGQAEPGLEPLDAYYAILDVGPFADLIELRHFEEAVARLEAVRDVRVRRFGHRRAMVELGLGGPYAVGRELFRLGRPMQIEPGPEGEIIVDFTDVPDEPAPEAQSQPPAETPAATATGDSQLAGPADGTEPPEGEQRTTRSESENV